MPSYLHELILLLFRNHSGSATELLRELDVQLPEHDEIQAESSDLSDLRPAEYRADLVLLLLHQTRKVLGVIVEVQLARDDNKPYAWPAYIANLRARHRCPACLLVITIEDAVARWASRPIELGPGSQCTPWVVGPSNAPAVTELRNAKDNVEFAVLSAIEHGDNRDVALAIQIASAAIVASADIDAERSSMYLDLILLFLTRHTSKALETTMNSLGFDYQSEFALRHFFKGKTEGRTEIILRQLELRFGPLNENIQDLVRRAESEQVDAVVERVLTAQSLDEALSPLT